MKTGWDKKWDGRRKELKLKEWRPFLGYIRKSLVISSLDFIIV